MRTREYLEEKRKLGAIVAVRLYNALKKREMSVSELAEIIDAAPEPIYRQLNGDSTPGCVQIVKYAAGLLVSTDYLLGVRGANTMKKTVKNILVFYEGWRNKAYHDHLGKLTIGVGHLVKAYEDVDLYTVWTNEKVEDVFDKDVQLAIDECFHLCKKSKLIISDNARMALTLMIFQMGLKGVGKFQKMLQALIEQDYLQAHKEALTSKWAEQTPGRAHATAMLFMLGDN